MNILVTGSNGFIGKHMCLLLKKNGHNVFEYDLNSGYSEYKEFISKCDFVIHLAGINRALVVDELYVGNALFTEQLANALKSRNVPIIFSSSIQASLDNDYGQSKKMAEEYLFSSGLPVYVYRLANVFGKWAKPNYNSAFATFCYNIAHELDIEIRDKEYVVKYNYIDDVVNEFLKIVELKEHKGNKEILYINPTYECSLGKLSELLYYFKGEIESERHLPLIHNEFELKLFKTFCNYLSDEGYSFNSVIDNRGSFEELYKSKKWGQISENIINVGITKGGHYHKYKKEIFETVVGETEIKERNISNNELLEYTVNGNNPTKVDILVGYTHQIKNIGKEKSHTLMWISEIYNPNTEDTYKEDVE